MVDIVDSKTRSRMMSGIRGRDTKPEVKVRKALWQRGFRYRIPRKKHYKGLPGIPDMVFVKHRAVILVNGCFFHGHGCSLFKYPDHNGQKWSAKIQGNRERDARFAEMRRQQGWRTLTIWECALRGPRRLPFERVVKIAVDWLESGTQDATIEGKMAT